MNSWSLHCTLSSGVFDCSLLSHFIVFFCLFFSERKCKNTGTTVFLATQFSSGQHVSTFDVLRRKSVLKAFILSMRIANAHHCIQRWHAGIVRHRRHPGLP